MMTHFCCLVEDRHWKIWRVLNGVGVMGTIEVGVKVGLCEILRKYQLKYQQDTAHIRYLIM